jgi:gliding motility-associated-like protein
MSNSDKIFDQLIKDSVKNHESGFNADSWKAVKSGINSTTIGSGAKNSVSLGKWFIASIVLGAVAFSGFLIMDSESPKSAAILSESKIEKEKAVVESNLALSETETLKSNVASDETIEDTKPEFKQTASITNNQVKVTPKETGAVNKKAKTKVAPLKVSQNESLIKLNSNLVCESDIVTFKASDSLGNASYLWHFGDGEKAISYKVKHPYKEEGNYEVTLQVKLESGEILKSTKNIYVNSKPRADFNFETTDYNCHNSSICFSSDISASFNELYWNFGDDKFSDDPNPKHTYHKKGHYNVKLRVESSAGCNDSTLKQVYVMRAFNLLATKDFSPNDDGKKDTWIPIALQNRDQNFTINILNQMGQPVYSTSSADAPWNGKLNNGGNAKSGELYIWIALVEDSLGNLNEYGGSILITD